MGIVVAGIDLAALEKNQTGLCLMAGRATTSIVRSDAEILAALVEARPSIIAIDAPLTLPRNDHYRGCDRGVREAGIPIFSFNLPALQKLAERGMRLAAKIRRQTGAELLETYPHAVLRLNAAARRRAEARCFATKHEKDAYLCALVAQAFARGRARCFSGGGKLWY